MCSIVLTTILLKSMLWFSIALLLRFIRSQQYQMLINIYISTPQQAHSVFRFFDRAPTKDYQN
jgi:hypothetical protein